MALVDARPYGALRRPNALAKIDILHGDRYAYSQILVYVCLDVGDSLGKSMFPKSNTDICKLLLYGCVKGLHALGGPDTQGKLSRSPVRLPEADPVPWLRKLKSLQPK